MVCRSFRFVALLFFWPVVGLGWDDEVGKGRF